MKLIFKPIDLTNDRDTCVAFREDSFVASFGDATRFHEADGQGAQRYLEWLKAKIAKDPATALHVWSGSEIIGQLELGLLRDDPSCGYVNLYYLKPSARGTGVSAELDSYVFDYFRKQGLQRMRLSVSPTNARALAYYVKMGWKDLGPREGHPEVHFMEKWI